MNRNNNNALILALLSIPLIGLGCGGGGSESGDSNGDATGDTETRGDTETGGNSGDGDGAPGDGDGAPGDGDGSPGDGDGAPGDGDGAPGDGDGAPGDGDGDGAPGDGDGDGSPGDGDGDGDQCVPTEDVEVTCDFIDNNCDGLVDNVDVGNDGFCDCLNIGIIGAPGFAPTSDFEAWLEDQGTTVTRTLIPANQPGIVTPQFLAQYDVVIVDRIQRGLSPEEAAAIEDFVKTDGRGVLTLIGYNFDNGNPGPERDRANTVLAPFGLAYTGGYIHTNGGVTPTFDQTHPISMGILDVNYAGGIIPVDNGNQGASEIFATVPLGDAGLAHETAGGGRVLVWGDEWITFDSDWQGFADVQQFWSQMIAWVKPQDFCGSPQ